MAHLAIYTDEDVAAEVATQLRRHGYDAISCRDAGNHNLRFSDQWQLAFATSLGRAIVTRNVTDYIYLDNRWRDQGREHAGIICLDGDPHIAEMIRRLGNHLERVTAEDQFNVLLWAW